MKRLENYLYFHDDMCDGWIVVATLSLTENNKFDTSYSVYENFVNDGTLGRCKFEDWKILLSHRKIRKFYNSQEFYEFILLKMR